MKHLSFRALLTLILAIPAGSAEYKVEPGADIGAALKPLKPGDTLILTEGVHPNGFVISGIKGTPKAPIVIRGETGAVVRAGTERDGILFWQGEPQYVVLENLRIEGGRRAGVLVGIGSHHITIRDCVMADNGKWGVQTCLSDYVTVERCELYGSLREHGIYFSTTDHPVARGCYIHDNAACGIHFNGDKSEGGDGMISDGLVEDNVICRNGKGGGAAINMDGVERTTVRNNLIHRNWAGGIVSFHGDGDHSGADNRFVSNTVFFLPGAGRYGLKIEGSRNAEVRHNILVCGRGPALEIDREALQGLAIDGNLYFNHGSAQPIELAGTRLTLEQWKVETKQDAGSACAKPFFVDSSAGDFGLRTNSPAIRLKAGIAADGKRKAVSGKREAEAEEEEPQVGEQ